MYENTTIAAISTAFGIGGIGIIRISGKEAFAVVSKIFKPKDASFDILNPKQNSIKYGIVFEENEIIDEVLVSFFNNNKSYTTENMVEINCHGGIIVTKKIFDLVIKNGARVASPGEFTKRAFLNGRIDLIQAESVIDIISSKTDKARSMAVSQLKGGLSKKINEVKENFYDMLSKIEVQIDYPEEIEENLTKSEITINLIDTLNKLNKIIETYDEGKILKDGIRTVIIGKPNVGKSSLMNYLLKEERAIVTDIEGTTRDTIEEIINIAGIPIIIVDTAGIRETEDKIENIGIKKAIDEINSADMVIAIFDLSRNLDYEDKKIIDFIKNKKSLIIANKSDLKNMWDIKDIFNNEDVINISLKQNDGLEKIEKSIMKMWSIGKIENSEEAVVTNIRHKNLIYDAIEETKNAIDAIKENMPTDIISINIKIASEKIGEILGDNVTEDIIERIFEKFCVGK